MFAALVGCAGAQAETNADAERYSACMDRARSSPAEGLIEGGCDAFILETMYWPDEIREADFGGVDVSMKVRPNELDMAQTLIDNLSADWDPGEFKDEYREAMLRIVEAKINGEEIEVVEAEPAAKVVDLMEALKASVAAAKKEAKAEPATKKKAPARKKTAAKKPAAKKPAAKKPAARKKAVGE